MEYILDYGFYLDYIPDKYVTHVNQCNLLQEVLVWFQSKVRGGFLNGMLDDRGWPLAPWIAWVRRAENLLRECSNPDLQWLQKAVKQEERKHDFSLLLAQLSELFSNCPLILCGYYGKHLEEALPVLQSARNKLDSAARKDRRNLLARVTEVIKAKSDYNDDDVELAQFLQGVLSAETIEAEKQARRINPRGLVYGNTLGDGGYAKVVKACWKSVSDFAVKENKGRYFHDKEVEAGLGISHPNVMSYIAYSSEPPSEEGINERNVLVMELMDGDLGGTLSELSQKGLHFKRLLNLKTEILCDTARGLKYLHEKKIVHRDLKPANILVKKELALGDEGKLTVKIADFGSSRSCFDHKTVATAPVGTRMYMAPEMMGADDTSMYGPEVDIYSFGMICYKVITGMDPSDLNVHQGRRPPLKASASCPQALVSFIHKCWHQDPDKRPSASQVYDFLTLFKHIGLLSTPARETSCLPYAVTDTLLEKLVSFLGKEWLETEATALKEGTISAQDLQLHKQVTHFLSRLSKKPRRTWLSLPFFGLGQ